MLNATLAANILALLTGTVDIGEVSHRVQFGPSVNLTDGAGANQANKLFADTRTLAASATENLDLSGVLVDAIGAQLAFTKIKGLLIRAAAANVNNVIVGGLNAAAFGVVSLFGVDPSSLIVRPGGFVLLAAPDAAGYAVTAGTGDLLKIANSGAGSAVTYDVVIIGA